MTRPDSVIRGVASVTVAALAGLAGAISYSHMTALAAAHGETGWRTHAFPLSVDGVEVVASVVLLADRRDSRQSGWLPWTALVAGTAASFAANVAVGGSDWIGRAVAGWPAFSLLTAIKLLFSLVDTAATESAAASSTATSVKVSEDPTVGSATVLADQAVRASANGSEADGDLNDKPQRRTGATDGRSRSAPGGRRSPPGTDTAPVDVTTLLPAARIARVTLLRNGQSVTRKALARQLRADGCTASNARVSAVLKALAAEPVPVNGAHPQSRAPDWHR